MHDHELNGPFLDKAQTGETEDGATVHFARSVLDLDAPHGELAIHCLTPTYSSKQMFTGHGALYVMGAAGKPYCKVGITENPQWRRDGIQTCNWDRIELFYVVWAYDKAEKIIERRVFDLADQRGFERRGEWIGVEPSAALTLIFDAARELNADIGNHDALTASQRDYGGACLHLRMRASAAEKQNRSAALGY